MLQPAQEDKDEWHEDGQRNDTVDEGHAVPPQVHHHTPDAKGEK